MNNTTKALIQDLVTLLSSYGNEELFIYRMRIEGYVPNQSEKVDVEVARENNNLLISVNNYKLGDNYVINVRSDKNGKQE